MRRSLDAGVPFCLVVASAAEQAFARDIVATLTATGDVAARSAAFTSVASRRDDPPDALVVALDSSTLQLGAELIGRVHGASPACAVLAVGERLTPDQASSLRAGRAFDFVAVPGSASTIAARVRRALAQILSSRSTGVHALLNPRIKGLIGASPAFFKQMSKLPTIASCDAGVLILGETGTGKEACAQAIHYLSARASKPWIAVNCGAIANGLVEDELFGHVKGAYTTAHAERHGLVREAEGGTLFLDDIDALERGAQAKLLRFLQEKEYRSVGSNRVHRADVRVIAASNDKLDDMAMQGTFRQDLFFRLNALTLTLPPLRERREDVPLMAQHFLREYAQQWNRSVAGLSPPAVMRLLSYDWPGNVRQLKHVIERAVLFADRPLLGADDIELGGDGAPAPANESFKRAKSRAIEQFERAYIEQLLIAHRGNITHAAHAALKNRRAFWQLIRKYRIEPQRFRAAAY